jgi:hypothetical protein
MNRTRIDRRVSLASGAQNGGMRNSLKVES